MFCTQCSSYLSEGQNSCPNCGQSRSKETNKYYCKSCKRYLLYKICPIHGLEDVEVISSAQGGSSGSSPVFEQAGARCGKYYALPSAHNTQTVDPPRRSVRLPVIDETKEKQQFPPFDGYDPTDPWQNYTSQSAPFTGEKRDENNQRKQAPRPTPPPKDDPIEINPNSRREPFKSPNSNHQPQKAPPRQRVQEKPERTATRSSFTAVIAGKMKWVYASAATVVFLIFGAIFYSAGGSGGGFNTAGNKPFFDSVSGAVQNLFSGFFNESEAAPANTITQINELMANADQAFQKQQYLYPYGENAYQFLSSILELDPNYLPALEMQDQIVEYYFAQAELAFEEEKYSRAVYFYGNILKIKPDDPDIIREINRTIELRKVNAVLASLGDIAEAREQIKKLRREKYRLKTQIKKERSRLNDLAQQAATRSSGASTKQNAAGIGSVASADSKNKDLELKPWDVPGSSAKESFTNNTTTNSTAAASGAVSYSPSDSRIPGNESTYNSIEELLGIELVGDDDSGVVAEGMIDGGRKEYLHREKPYVPSRLRKDELVLIEVECIVDMAGIVESVNILSPSKNKELNKLAEETFRKYRFKPATYRGEPTRFKSIEIFAVNRR